MPKYCRTHALVEALSPLFSRLGSLCSRLTGGWNLAFESDDLGLPSAPRAAAGSSEGLGIRHCVSLLSNNVTVNWLRSVLARSPYGRQGGSAQTIPYFAALDALEARQMLSVASLNLHLGCIRLDPGNADVVQVYESATPTGTPNYTYSRSALSALTITGDDTLTIDYSNGSPLKDGVLTYNAGTGDDTVILIGRDTYRATISPTTDGGGRIEGYLQSFTYTGVESISVQSINTNHFSTVTLVTPNADDNITLDRSAAGIATLTGSSGSVTLPTISIAGDVPKIDVHLSGNDLAPLAGNQSVTLTGNDDPANFYTLVEFGNGANNTFTASATHSAVELTGPAITANVSPITASAPTELDFVTNQTLDSLMLNGSAKVKMAADTPRDLHILTSLTLSPDATLDLNASQLVLDVDAADSVSAVTLYSALAAGRNIIPGGVFDGPWDGSVGLTSSTAAQAFAANGSSEIYALGYGDTRNMPYNDSSDMQDSTLSALFVKYTRVGDATMDGIVGDTDVSVVGALYDPNYDPTGPGGPMQWWQGDFNYNGIVDDNDVTVIGLQYDATLALPGLAMNSQAPSHNIHFNGNDSIAVDESITLSLDWNGQGDPITSWVIYWMDGTTPNEITLPAGANPSTIAHVSAAHGYTAPGDYPILAIAKTATLDHFVGMGILHVKAANPDTLTVSATPANPAPVAEGEPYTLLLNAPKASRCGPSTGATATPRMSPARMPPWPTPTAPPPPAPSPPRRRMTPTPTRPLPCRCYSHRPLRPISRPDSSPAPRYSSPGKTGQLWKAASPLSNRPPAPAAGPSSAHRRPTPRVSPLPAPSIPPPRPLRSSITSVFATPPRSRSTATSLRSPCRSSPLLPPTCGRLGMLRTGLR